MEDDWEAEDFVPVPPVIVKEKPKGTWDDEDASDEDVKESWEDEEAIIEPKPASKPEPKPEKKKATESNVKTANVQDGKLPDPVAEKLRQQRLVEEADYQSTTELFGKSNGDKSLDSFIPKSEDDFMEYAELVAHKLRPFDKSFHYVTLLKAVMRHAMTTLKAADAKDVASSVTVIANEKIKAEKESNAGKKKSGTKKKQLHVDRADDDALVGTYADIDDYDFM